MEVVEDHPNSDLSEGEESDDVQPLPEEVPRKGYGKKTDFFGAKGSNSRYRDDKGGTNGLYHNVVDEESYESPGGHKHMHRHKKFRRHQAEVGPKSSRTLKRKHDNDDEISEDMEDGEILEDGEIEDEELEEEDPSPPKKSSVESSKSSPAASREHRHSHQRDRHREEEEKEAGEANEEEEVEGEEKSRKDKKKKKRSRKEKHDRKDREKKRRRHGAREYKDPDRPEDQDVMSFDKRSRSPPGPYESPAYNSPSGQYDSPAHNRSPSKRRNSPSQYERSCDSPPGLYDSPSYDEDSEDGSHTLMRTLSGTGYDGEFMDPDNQKPGHGRKRKAGHLGRHKRRTDDNQIQSQPRKKPLLEIPRHERPHCKFYMEGKCAKGGGCPFNHDFRPPRKQEICKFYLLSNCTKGDFCIYMHGEYPCKYFHTGADCYQGDNCKFSHDPLTDETRPLLDRMMHNEEMDRPRPCLLGSPPRHLLEGGEPPRKIPSLFEIEVFPPGQGASPRKPLPSSPSVRPSGFYQDSNSSPQAPGSGPPMVLPAPAQQQGPQGPQVQPMLNMIGAILRGAPPDVVARVGVQGANQGPPGMQGPRMPGMGPRGPFMGPGSSPDRRDFRGPRGPGPGGILDIRGPGPNFHDPRGPPMMDQGPGGRMPPMDHRDPRGQGGPPFDPNMQGMGPRGHFGPRGPPPGMDLRGPPPGMNPRGPLPGMDPRGPPPRMDTSCPPPGMDPRGPPPGMDPRGISMDARDPRGMDQRDPRTQNICQGDSNTNNDLGDPRNQNMDPRDQRNQNMDPRDQRSQKMDPRDQHNPNFDMSRNQITDPRDHWNQKSESVDSRDPRSCNSRDVYSNVNNRENVSDSGEPSSDSNVTLQSRDPRARMQNSRDPRNVTNDQQDGNYISSSKNESDSRVCGDNNSASEDSLDVRGQKISPQYETGFSPSAHRDGTDKHDGADSKPSREADKPMLTKLSSDNDSETKDNPEIESENEQNIEDNREASKGNEKEENDGDLEAIAPMDIPSHLPPTQRNLFMRIQHQQHQQQQLLQEQQEQQQQQQHANNHESLPNLPCLTSEPGEATEASDDAASEPAKAGSKAVEDDDWYSSDEESDGAPNLMDVLKNLNKQPVPPPLGSPQAGSASTASTFNIMQMIQNIKNHTPSSTQDKTAPAPQPKVETSPPSISKRRESSDKSGSGSLKEVVRDFTRHPNLTSMNSAYPVIEAVLTSMTYRIKSFLLSLEKPYYSLPCGVDPQEPSYQYDPRVQKYVSRMGKIKPVEKVKSMPPLPAEKEVTKPVNVDPRKQHQSGSEEKTSAKPLDPRLRRAADAKVSTSTDHASPVSLEILSDEIARVLDSHSNPRLQRGHSNTMPMSHSLPVRPVNDPRRGPISDPRQDPRNMIRQHSHDGLPMRPNDPRSGPPPPNDNRLGPDQRMAFDPRMGPGPRMGSGHGMGPGLGPRPPFDNRMPFNPRMPFGPGGPRMDSRMLFDQRMGPDQRMGQGQDQRMGPGQDQRIAPGPDQRMGPGQDQRMGPGPEQRMGPDQRMQFNPRMGLDQRVHNEPPFINDPRSGGPRMAFGPPGQGDPRSSGSQCDQRLGPTGDSKLPEPPGDNWSSGSKFDPRSCAISKGDPRGGGDPKTASAGSDPRLGSQKSGDDPWSQGFQKNSSDTRNVSSGDPRQSHNLPSTLPKLGDSRILNSDNANTSESESGLSDSQSGEQPGKKFDYRNDPRFKRKPAADSGEKSVVKKFTGQRKSSMEYSSPLGIDDSKSDGSGYNSYNRPNPQSKPPNKGSRARTNPPVSSAVSASAVVAPKNSGQSAASPPLPLPDLPHPAGLAPPQLSSAMMPPPVPHPNEPPLKDLFKLIDPTASPFC